MEELAPAPVQSAPDHEDKRLDQTVRARRRVRARKPDPEALKAEEMETRDGQEHQVDIMA